MAAITEHYNVTVDCRYYAFLQDDMESAEPHDLIRSVEKKRELRKENKTKAKKEKRSKQIANNEAIKENIKIESVVEENLKIENEITVESKPEAIEKPIETQEPLLEEKTIENKYDRSSRGRGNNRRQNGGPRRGGYPRNEERTYSNDDGSHQKSQDSEYNRYVPNSRGRPFRKERSEGESCGKFGYFEDQSGVSSRGTSVKRRSSGRPSGRYSRGSDRLVNDRPPNERSGHDRNGNERFGTDRTVYDRNGNEKNKNDEENMKIDIIPESMGTFEDMSSRPPRSSRGRYPRANRGSFNRFHAPNSENDFENNRIGYFDENMENREFRGGRGRSRGGRSIRRGRGEPWRQKGNDREENPDDGSNNFKTENRDVPVEKWPEFDEEPDLESSNNEPSPNANMAETDFSGKKSNWGEIEDDPVGSKATSMTLEEYRALTSKDRLFCQEGKENRKANDGQDVFSGMEEYRKGRFVEEQGDEHENHESQHGRQKQSITVSIRFSRNAEYGDSNNFEQTGTDNRNFSRGSFKNESKFRGDNSSGGRGRSRGGSDFNTYGRGRDFNRGRGRFNRNSYPMKRKEDQVDGININLGNEDEFPSL